MAKVVGQWVSGADVASAPRMSAHLSNVSIGPEDGARAVSYTHLTLPTNREV